MNWSEKVMEWVITGKRKFPNLGEELPEVDVMSEAHKEMEREMLQEDKYLDLIFTEKVEK